jgi:hypothetical protein
MEGRKKIEQRPVDRGSGSRINSRRDRPFELLYSDSHGWRIVGLVDALRMHHAGPAIRKQNGQGTDRQIINTAAMLRQSESPGELSGSIECQPSPG